MLLMLQVFTECLLCARRCARWFRIRKDTVPTYKEFTIPDDYPEMSIAPLVQMRPRETQGHIVSCQRYGGSRSKSSSF